MPLLDDHAGGLSTARGAPPGPWPAMPDERTRELLTRWHAGDRAAIDELVARDLPWITTCVRARLGPLLRGRGETADYVHDALLGVLDYAPRFVTGSRRGFRALVARMIENHLRDAHDHHAAARRTPLRERPVPNDSVLDLDRPAGSVTRPGSVAERNERAAWVRLAVETLDRDDRRVVVLREWHGLEFAAIGERLGIAADTARMRFQRALPRLAARLEQLRRGELPLAHDGGTAGDDGAS